MRGIEEVRVKALEILETKGVKSQILEHGAETQVTIRRNREALD